MKLVLNHPLRDWWLRLKALVPHAPPAEIIKPPLRRTHRHRTIAFFDLP